jgi:uncharacterized protein VirK/YbjX
MKELVSIQQQLVLLHVHVSLIGEVSIVQACDVQNQTLLVIIKLHLRLKFVLQMDVIVLMMVMELIVEVLDAV